MLFLYYSYFYKTVLSLLVLNYQFVCNYFAFQIIINNKNNLIFVFHYHIKYKIYKTNFFFLKIILNRNAKLSSNSKI